MSPNFISDLLRKPTWMIFLISWLFYLIGLFLFSQMVWDANTYLIGFKGTNFDEYLSNIRKIDTIRYALSPIWVIGISTIIWAVIKSGLIIIEVEFNALLLFKIILLGFIFISLPFWVKAFWLVLFKGGYTPDDVKHFFPCSIISFIDTTGMTETIEKILSRINMFHLSFMLFTSWCISRNAGKGYSQSFLLVLFTYGIGLAIVQCLIFVMVM